MELSCSIQYSSALLVCLVHDMRGRIGVGEANRAASPITARWQHDVNNVWPAGGQHRMCFRWCSKTPTSEALFRSWCHLAVNGFISLFKYRTNRALQSILFLEAATLDGRSLRNSWFTLSVGPVAPH